LIPGDVGRPISDIKPNIALPDLDKLAQEVIDSLTVKELEVKDDDGHWYSLRVRPYRTSENKIDGAVIVLVDIGDIRQGLEEVADIVPEPMLILSSDLRVNKANEAFYQKFRLTPPETEGQPLYRLRNGQWSIPALRTLLESVLPMNHRVENFELEQEVAEEGKRKFLVSARRLYQQSKGTHYVLMLLHEPRAESRK
jgi:two-component system CheB/CheR fusion protein